MASLLRVLRGLGALALLAPALVLCEPCPVAAEANILCDTVSGPVDTVAGGVGLGSPAADVCNAVTAPGLRVADKALDPLKDAASSIGNGIFNQITNWVAEGAGWLLGEVARLSESTTTPNLLSKGFLSQYQKMALIASLMAALMVLFAIIEAVGRGDFGMLVRVFAVNIPLAAIATSAAYVVVQLLLVATDGLCDLITTSTRADTKDFFATAIKGLASTGAQVSGLGGKAVEPVQSTTAAPGAVSVPLFVGLIAAIVAAFGAFLVWVELLMRDAAVYAVSLFMPLGLAAAVWPRWASALRRTAELVIVVVFSKFVIVAILALAASFLAKGEGGIESLLSAGALLLLACFSPLVLLRLVPFAEGAISASHSRQSAAGGAMRSAHMASSAQSMYRGAFGGRGDDGVRILARGGGAGTSGAGSSRLGGSAGGGSAEQRRAATAGSAGAGAGAGAPAGLAAKAPVAVGKAAGTGAGRLAESGVGQASASAGAPPSAGRESGGGPRPGRQPSAKEASSPGWSPVPAPAPEPSEAGGGKTTSEQPPRPAPELGSGEPAKGEGK